MRSGRSGNDQAPQVSTIRSPKSAPGIARATEPVARTTAPASYVSEPTVTLPSASSAPFPSIIVTLFLSQSIFTPPARVSETFVRRSPSAFQSSDASLTVTPRSAEFLA